MIQNTRKRRGSLRPVSPKRIVVRQAISLVNEISLDLSGVIANLDVQDESSAGSLDYLNADLERLYGQLGRILSDLRSE